MALWNEEKSWPHTDEGEFRLLDYEFPLKARRCDQGIGEVDLLGITKQGRLMVVELKKVKGNDDNDRGDTPPGCSAARSALCRDCAVKPRRNRQRDRARVQSLNLQRTANRTGARAGRLVARLDGTKGEHTPRGGKLGDSL